MRLSIPTMLLVAMFAGCAGDDVAGTQVSSFEFAIADDAERDVELEVSGGWLRKAGNGTWTRIIDNGDVFGPERTNSSAAVAPGRYERLRIVLANVSVDGEPVHLAENGFELPLNISLPAGATTRLAVGFAWADALFTSTDGLSFLPVLGSIEVSRDGVLLLRLGADQISTTSTKPPVARMEIFDAQAARVFETDFVAASPRQRIVAVGPNLTFQAGTSEAVEAGAALTSYNWEFGDGTSGKGATVSHEYPLSGGNFTVRLTVTDSRGVSDSQTVRMALAPGTFTARERAGGTVTGVYPSSCATSANGHGMASHTLSVDAAQTPDGVAADLVGLRVNLYVVGNGHAGANIDLRVLDPAGQQVGTGTSAGTSEVVQRTYQPGAAPGGDWTLQVKPCVAADLDYEVVSTLTWLAKEPENGYLKWLASYDDGHDHQH